MKQLLFIIAMLSCVAAFGQSQKDYEHAMARYQRYYNNGNEDSIIYMFSDDIGKEYKQERLKEVQNKKGDLYYGVMRSWRYVDIDTEGTQGKPEEGARFFLVTFDKRRMQ
jgi:nicotinic acid phosphoribosyltransferase